MADLPELWTDRTPERQPPAHQLPERRYLYDQVPTFGVAHEAELMRQGVPPARRVVKDKRPRRERGPFVTCLRAPWSYGDNGPSDRWHRIRCRMGRHEIYGGHVMQMGSAMVFIERRCRWCGVEPA